MTRLCKMKGFRGFIAGKDNDNMFEEDVIYNVQKFMGEIVLTPIGESSELNKYGDKIRMQSLDRIIAEGDYLFTKEELFVNL